MAMGNNLVPGGARPGWFMTRQARLVHIRVRVEREMPLEPGQEKPTKKFLWVGDLMQMDGKTVDTEMLWEDSGALASRNGVATSFDLAQLVRLDKQALSAA